MKKSEAHVYLSSNILNHQETGNNQIFAKNKSTYNALLPGCYIYVKLTLTH